MLLRTVSAVVAVLILFALFFFLKVDGLLIITFVVVFLASFELSKILFANSLARGQIFQPLFLSTNMLAFSLLIFLQEFAGGLFAMLVLLYCMALLWHLRWSDNTDQILRELAFSVLGLMYTSYLTHYCGRLLLHDQGAMWFAFLLAIPMAGDTFAFFVGKLFGRRKILPNVSPKKTVEGALGGLVGSISAAMIIGLYIDHPLEWTLPLLGLACGIFAQVGDFFESLIKRAARVKDSGVLFPGHGGILDRIDGVIFTCPVLFFYVQFLDATST